MGQYCRGWIVVGERLKYSVIAAFLSVLLSGCGELETATECTDVAGDQFNEQRYASALHLWNEAIALEPDNFSA